MEVKITEEYIIHVADEEQLINFYKLLFPKRVIYPNYKLTMEIKT